LRDKTDGLTNLFEHRGEHRVLPASLYDPQ
jgi:hypothetical protein